MGRRRRSKPRGRNDALRTFGVPLAGAALFFILSWTAAGTKSATFDEGVHLLSGYRIVTADDYAFNREHPPLMKALAALPLVVTGAARPLEHFQSHRSFDEWPLSHRWLYHRNDADRLLALGRLPIALVGALLGLAIFAAVRSVATPLAATCAVFLFAVEPNLLANGALVTTDMGMAVFYFAGAAAFWRHLATGRRRWLVAAGILWGLDLAAKFTAVLLGPVYLLMGAAWILTGAPRPDPDVRAGRRWLNLAVSLGAAGGLALLVLAATYRFEGLFTPLRSMHLYSDLLGKLAAGWAGLIPLPLPAAFVAGFDHASRGGQVWWSYMMGEYSMTGWREYYLVALAVKTSIPLMLLAATGLLLGGRAGADRRARWILLFLPAALLVAAFTLSPAVKNIGVRYVLGVYPFLCALGGLGAAALWEQRAKWLKGIAAILILWAAVNEAVLYPDHLTFFNVAAGGPDGGRRWLVDSNLDWGQDLKGLGRWMRANDVGSIWLDYFGRACPRYEGVHTVSDFEGGWIAVSVTNLVGVFRQEDRDRYRFLENVKPVANIGHTILVWNVPKPPGWKPLKGTPDS